MPIDGSASNVATSALTAIPFGTLIAAPLKAAIEAQQMAARTTTDFIQEVGFNTDASGNKSAVNIVFQYERAGQTVNLVVPLLVILPIPFIAVEEITIDFKASISASASSVQSDETTVQKGASGSVSGHVGGRMWGVSATFNANYSSKRDSKSTQESKYSVEYTMDIHVSAKQDSMPAGLAAVLNILTSAISEKPALTSGINVTVGNLDPTTHTRVVTAKLINSEGNAVANATVNFTGSGSDNAKYAITPSAPTTDASGVVTATVAYSGDATKPGAAVEAIDVDAAIGSTTFGTKQTVDVTYKP